MKKSKSLIKILSIILIILIGILLVWLLEEFKADSIAKEMLDNENIQIIKEDVILISPNEESDIGFIFYPGAKVEYTAYIPILNEISNAANVNCFLVKMPLNYAFFDEDKAEIVLNSYTEIDSWYIGGHSLGSSIAGSFAGKNQELFNGVIYLGGYIYGDYPKEKSLTIYGSLEERVDRIIDYTENVVKIEGGNHSQFGNYGMQPGDKEANIDRATQQEITAEAINDFINSNK